MREQHANAASGTALRTHEEIAARFGVSRAMIAHIEQRALRKLRYAIECEAKAAGMTVAEWLATAS